MTKMKKNKKTRGFVILFAVTLSSILLAIALGIANIAVKEIKFSTSAKDTNDAFLAADTGAECALFYDRINPSNNAFTGTATISCAGASITLSGSSPSWSFIVLGLGNSAQGCAKVSVVKSGSSPVVTTVTSKGYNVGDANCNGTSSNRVEREIKVTY